MSPDGSGRGGGLVGVAAAVVVVAVVVVTVVVAAAVVVVVVVVVALAARFELVVLLGVEREDCLEESLLEGVMAGIDIGRAGRAGSDCACIGDTIFICGLPIMFPTGKLVICGMFAMCMFCM